MTATLWAVAVVVLVVVSASAFILDWCCLWIAKRADKEALES